MVILIELSILFIQEDVKNFENTCTLSPSLQQALKCAAILRYKVFFWLLLQDRLNTRNLLKRKSFQLPSYNCALCSIQCLESSFHLFWYFPFALRYWDSILTNRRRITSVVLDIQLAIAQLLKDIAIDHNSWGVGIFGSKETTRLLETSPTT